MLRWILLLTLLGAAVYVCCTGLYVYAKMLARGG